MVGYGSCQSALSSQVNSERAAKLGHKTKPIQNGISEFDEITVQEKFLEP